MQPIRLIIAAAFLTAAFAVNTASALSVDKTTNSKSDGSAKFDDPDDKIPFPHVGDDGSQPSSNFQAQPVGNSGVSFGLTPSNSQPDAFQRAQENQQQ